MIGPEKSALNRSIYPCLTFVIPGSLIPRFLLLLQRGFMIKTHVGCTIRKFLREEIGARPDIIEKIQSIFLNGRPVDDLDSAIIRDRSTLALSAAMPGLVGATMRRGGVYASFRGSITYRETGTECITEEGYVQLKLFNLLTNELGPDFLRKGILVKSSDLIDFLKGLSRDFWRECEKVLFDDNLVDPASLEKLLMSSKHGWVSLMVTTLRGAPERLNPNIFRRRLEGRERPHLLPLEDVSSSCVRR
jgi:hypothetical protein